MSSFPPPNWEVQFLKDMDSLACEAKDSTRPSIAAYLAVKSAGGEEGNFRFVLAAPHNICLDSGLWWLIWGRGGSYGVVVAHW